MFKNFRIFQKILVLIFALFMGVLISILFFVNTRKSGVTGLTMAQIQEMRMKPSKEKSL